MTDKQFRKLMIAIVASGFISDYTTHGLVERATAIVDLIEANEEKIEENGTKQAKG